MINTLMNIFRYTKGKAAFAAAAALAAVLAGATCRASALTWQQKRLDAARADLSPQQAEARQRKKEEQQATELEAFFLQKMLEDVFPKGEGVFGLYGGGPGDDIYRSMTVEHAARAWAKQGGVGLARQMTEQARRRRGEVSPASVNLKQLQQLGGTGYAR